MVADLLDWVVGLWSLAADECVSPPQVMALHRFSFSCSFCRFVVSQGSIPFSFV